VEVYGYNIGKKWAFGSCSRRKVKKLRNDKKKKEFRPGRI
jgi:hypothetical protein